MQTLLSAMVGGSANTEHVNADRFLDYDSTVPHQLAERIHGLVAPRIGELERAGDSCTPESRSDALYLMNFTGAPERAIRYAAMRMNDPDAGVRNAATRLLFSFNSFIAKGEVANIVQNACAATVSGGFTDRNKSLLVLAGLLQRGLISFQTLDGSCQQQIRGIARTSTASQTGEPARQLVASAGKDHS